MFRSRAHGSLVQLPEVLCLWKPGLQSVLGAVEVTSERPWERAISVSTCLVTCYGLVSQCLWEQSVSLKPRS